MTEYHYTECGLSNVYIDGIRRSSGDDDGDWVTIRAAPRLHAMICVALLLRDQRLAPDELRFLLQVCRYSHREMGRIVGVDSADIRGWERGDAPIAPVYEMLIRLAAADFLRSFFEPDEKLGPISVEMVSRQVATPPPDESMRIKLRANGDTYELIQY